MNLPILLIFYVSKWKNNKKHWKIGKWRTSLGVASQNWVWGFFVRRWSLCVNLMTLALLVPEIQRGVRGAPPQSQIDQKSPVWIGLNSANSAAVFSCLFVLLARSSPHGPRIHDQYLLVPGLSENANTVYWMPAITCTVDAYILTPSSAK